MNEIARPVVEIPYVASSFKLPTSCKDGLKRNEHLQLSQSTRINEMVQTDISKAVVGPIFLDTVHKAFGTKLSSLSVHQGGNHTRLTRGQFPVQFRM